MFSVRVRVRPRGKKTIGMLPSEVILVNNSAQKLPSQKLITKKETHKKTKTKEYSQIWKHFI